jgi:hypothetical protein
MKESQGKRKLWIQLLKNTKEARTKRGKKREEEIMRKWGIQDKEEKQKNET